MSHPSRYLIRMAIFVIAIALVVGLLWRSLYPYFLGNPLVNGVIVGILIAGIAYIFHQVTQLGPETRWLERFKRNQEVSGHTSRLLAPLGRALVQSVKGVIGGMAPGTGDPAHAFADLQARLATPLGGMSTAFSASLFGLAGSLVLGFLDLQAGLAQNHFFNELEEWLSGQTRLTTAGPAIEAEVSPSAYIQALLEQTADSLDNLQRILARGEESRIAGNSNMVGLTEKLAALTDQMRTEQNLMLKLAEQQLEMRPVLARLSEGAGPRSDETLPHLRAIELHLARMAEDVSQGRGEAIQEIRNEIRLLARTIAALKEPDRARERS